MRITLEIDEEFAARMEACWGDLGVGVLRAIAAEGYRDGTLTREHVGRLLGLSSTETDAFLKAREDEGWDVQRGG